MASIWTHPKLGDFKYDRDECAWIGTADAPAFAIFTWELEGKPRKQYEIVFMVDDSSDKPSPQAAAVVLSVLAAQKELAPKVPQALWDDFTGKGPSSGMWWQDDLQEVAAGFDFDDRPAPRGPDDLLPVMRLGGIIVHEEMDGCDGPVVELSFEAVFEEEHGIGVLTDGKSILGLGYSREALPYGALDDDDEDDD